MAPASQLSMGAPRRLLVGLAAGACWVASLPPWGGWWLAPVTVALLGAALAGSTTRQRAAVGAIVGVVVFGWTLRWATIFTWPGYLALALSPTALLAVAAVAVPPRRGLPLALPAALVALDFVRYGWPLSGLPLSGLDLSQASGPLLPLAAAGGPLALTLVAAAAGSLLLAAARGGTTRGRVVAVAVAAAVFVVGAALPTLRLPGTTATTSLTVAAVQGGGVRGVPAVRADADAVFDRHLAASAALDPAVELVLWPEDVVDLDVPLAASSEGAALSSLARELDAVVVAGVVTTEAGTDPAAAAIRRFRNQAVAIGPDGALGDVYDKVIRVPFGEYVPARGLIDRFVDLSLVPRDAVAGVGAGTLDTAVGRLGVAISFEGLFAERARTAVRAGARLLLVPTNAASYVTDDVPSQQVAAARLRAVETGRSVVLAAPTGPSAIVTADGSVRARSDLEERAVLTGDVSLRAGLTPYARAGDAPVVALAAVLLAVGWAADRRRLPWHRAA